MLAKCKRNHCRQVVVSTAEGSISTENTLFCQIRTAGMQARQELWSEAFVRFSHVNWGKSDLTFVCVASLDISGDANDSQGVDACEAKEQREETIYLKRDREKGWWIMTCSKSLWVVAEASGRTPITCLIIPDICLVSLLWTLSDRNATIVPSFLNVCCKMQNEHEVLNLKMLNLWI